MVSKRADRAIFWQDHIEKYRSSGLSQRAYCLKNNLKVHQLVYCLGKHVQVQKKTGKSAFARVVVTDPITPVPSDGCFAARVIFQGGVSLEVNTSVDPIWIARLIVQAGVRL